MKKANGGIYLWRVLFSLVLGTILALPTTVTQSKYVWQDDIQVNLKITYAGQIITSIQPEGHPSEFWVQDLTNIQATPTADGLVLTAMEGYMMPEFITVKIGQTIFSVKTDGTEHPEGITFDATSGLLSILESLIDENPGGVTVSAVAVYKTIPAAEEPTIGVTPAESDSSTQEDTNLSSTTTTESDKFTETE